MIRTTALLGLALSLGLSLTGCVHSGDKLAKEARTPTQLYPLKAETRPDQVLLAIHADGLSPAQIEAVKALADRWHEGGGQMIQISAPHGKADSYAVYKTMQSVRDRLLIAGVPADNIGQTSYEAGDDANPPLRIEFTRYEAVVAKCGMHWDDLTKTEANVVQSNFGCAETANIAALVADPADLVHPRASDPADAGRRVTVLETYRKGQITATPSDAQASGAISKAVP